MVACFGTGLSIWFGAGSALFARQAPARMVEGLSLQAVRPDARPRAAKLRRRLGVSEMRGVIGIKNARPASEVSPAWRVSRLAS
jgi:hypothetical protein